MSTASWAGSRRCRRCRGLNRAFATRTRKDTTYVVDFVNEPGAMLAAFRQYHKTAELADVSDPNVVLDLRAKLDGIRG
jgi:type I restriction enzyme R subunit